MQDNEFIGQFSKGFDEKIYGYEKAGYNLEDIIIEFVVHWKDRKRELDKEHALCKIILRRPV